jgi:hypothetical protein
VKLIVAGMLIASGLVVTGCQSAANSKLVEPAKPAADEATVPAPVVMKSRLFLLRDGLSFELGKTYEEALEVFRPDGATFEFTDLPGKFKPPFRGRGWETARESFGAITYQQRVVMAMLQKDRATPDELDTARRSYQDAFSDIEPVHVVGRKVQAWFWEDGGQTLMVIGTSTTTSSLQLTIALGTSDVMSEVGATQDAVREQSVTLDGNFLKQDPI